MTETTFNFYFGLAAPDTHEDLSSYFQDKKGNYFLYKIVVDEDMFYIYDTCNRTMPIDREFVTSFGTAMFGVAGVYNAADEAEHLFNKRIHEVEAVVEYWSKEDTQ